MPRSPRRSTSERLLRMNGISTNALTPAATPTSSASPPPDTIRSGTKSPAACVAVANTSVPSRNIGRCSTVRKASPTDPRREPVVVRASGRLRPNRATYTA